MGWGSNVLPSDQGVPGLVIVNESAELDIQEDGLVTASTGIGFQEICIKTLQAGLTGLEFAVGIPGTLGGALVSNAGAYRSNIDVLVDSIEIVKEGQVAWVGPEFMEFSYRDSVLRRSVPPPPIVLSAVRLRLSGGQSKAAYDTARDIQRKRISKQPAPASAGSFFKNVECHSLAARLDNLPSGLKDAGVVPAGYLIEKVGLKGCRYQGAQLHWRHANFMTNVGRASASAIRRLAEHAQAKVMAEFGALIEEEVLYLGDWSAWQKTGALD